MSLSSRKIIIFIGIVCIIVIGFILINGGKYMNDVEGLRVPTRKEARYMIDRFPRNMDGAPYPIFPLNYDIRLAWRKGLTAGDNFSREYLNMQALYRKALEQYLEETLNLSEFDESLVNSELGFVPLSKKEMEFHQKYSYFDFQFIYLRNNLPIERLDKEELDILRKYIRARNSDVTEELLDLVSGTFRRIIVVYENRGTNVGAMYHQGGVSAPNEALVLSINYLTGLNDGGGGERIDYLEQEFIPAMQEILSERLGHVVKVLYWV